MLVFKYTSDWSQADSSFSEEAYKGNNYLGGDYEAIEHKYPETEESRVKTVRDICRELEKNIRKACESFSFEIGREISWN
jgi:hypothetical protein